ncbi:MAG: glycosyltransferase family 2 protein, partial [Gemmataceae bacterium]
MTDATPLFLERFIEPYSGIELLGVGGYRPASAEPPQIEVWYDDARAVSVQGQLQKDGRFHFATQSPWEAHAKRCRVTCMVDGQKTTLADQPLTQIAPRGAVLQEPATNKGLRRLRKLLNPKNISVAHWIGRYHRGRERLLKARQRLQARLLMRRFRPRSAHSAFIAATEGPLVSAPAEIRVTFSILLPVYDIEPKWLKRAIESVRQQTYPHWQLCIADDASPRADLSAVYDRYSSDPRIRIVRRPTNGHICAATNSAADLATGDFITLLDHDDELAADALAIVARHLQSHPEADVLYSDEDKILESGERFDPQLKPEWSPELLLSYNYINHLTVIRRTLFERAGRYRLGYEGSQDHDLLLRVTELTTASRIVHIPQILYHWRTLANSTASAAGVKPYVHTAGRRAVVDALRRRGIAATLTVPSFGEKLGLPVLQLQRTSGPRLSTTIVRVLPDGTEPIFASATDLGNVDATIVECQAGPDIATRLQRIVAECRSEIVVIMDATLRSCQPDWLDPVQA